VQGFSETRAARSRPQAARAVTGWLALLKRRVSDHSLPPG